MPNNFIFQNDPLLSPEYMDAHIARLQELRDEVIARQKNTPTAEPERTVLDDINAELAELSDSQKERLFADADYKQLDVAIAQIAAQYQAQLLMPYVLQDKEGKKLLERQLLTIRTKRDDIVAMERAELDEFRKWKQSKTKEK